MSENVVFIRLANNIKDREVRDEDVFELCREIPHHDKLVGLYLEDIDISLAAIKCVCDVLRHNTAVRFLTFNNGKIGNEGAKYIAEMLATNRTLESLNLSYGGIEDDGAVELAKSLNDNTTLKSLSMNDNSFHDYGAVALGQMLEKNKTLHFMDLRDGDKRLSDDAKKALVQGLKQNRMELSYTFWEFVEDFFDEIKEYRRYKSGKDRGSILLGDTSVPDALWTNVLAQVRTEPSLVYHFIREKPELIEPSTTRKRKRNDRDALLA